MLQLRASRLEQQVMHELNCDDQPHLLLLWSDIMWSPCTIRDHPRHPRVLEPRISHIFIDVDRVGDSCASTEYLRP